MGSGREEGCPRGEPRWLIRRRAEAAAAMVRTEAAPPEQACLLYGVTVAQFEACRRAAERAIGRRVPARDASRFFGLRWPSRLS